MLSITTPFPHVGASAFLKPDAAPVRILRRHADGTALIAHTDPARPDLHRNASGNTTVPMVDLFATAAEAIGKRARRKAA